MIENEVQGEAVAEATPVAAEPVVTSEHIESAPTEPTFTQVQVGKMISHARKEAEAKAYAKAQKDLEAKYSVGGMKVQSPDDLSKMIDERVEKRSQELAQEQYAKQLLSDFTGKLKAGSEKYKDFDDVVGDLDLASNPHLVRWTNGLDNTADVLYDLGQHPEKYASVMSLAVSSPKMAMKKLQQLSESIKKNDEAMKAEKANAPLDHIKPTNTGMDNGKMAVKDYQALDWLRG